MPRSDSGKLLLRKFWSLYIWMLVAAEASGVRFLNAEYSRREQNHCTAVVIRRTRPLDIHDACRLRSCVLHHYAQDRSLGRSLLGLDVVPPEINIAAVLWLSGFSCGHMPCHTL